MRKVAAGHTMILEGHKMVAEGWRMFREAVDESMPGYLPQLLQQLKEKTMPMPPPSPMDIGQASQPVPAMPSPVREGENKNEEPIFIMISGHRNWTCPQCNTVRGSRNDAMPISDRLTQEKPWCACFAAFPLTIWIH